MEHLNCVFYYAKLTVSRAACTLKHSNNFHLRKLLLASQNVSIRSLLWIPLTIDSLAQSAWPRWEEARARGMAAEAGGTAACSDKLTTEGAAGRSGGRRCGGWWRDAYQSQQAPTTGGAAAARAAKPEGRGAAAAGGAVLGTFFPSSESRGTCYFGF